jgi:hypothetical protein
VTMKVSCPTCGVMVPTPNAKVTRMLARCSGCGGVFEFEDRLNEALDAVRTRVPAAPEGPLPFGIELHREDSALAAADGSSSHNGRGRLRIVRRWLSGESLLLLIVAIACDYTVAQMLRALWAFDTVGALVISLLLLAICLWLSYVAVARVINRTVIVVDERVFSVRHGPLPARGNCMVAVDDVLQLYTVEFVRPRRRERVYELRAQVRNGPTVTIAKNLSSPSQALFIERAVENHAGIEDSIMPGEVQK